MHLSRANNLAKENHHILIAHTYNVTEKKFILITWRDSKRRSSPLRTRALGNKIPIPSNALLAIVFATIFVSFFVS